MLDDEKIELHKEFEKILVRHDKQKKVVSEMLLAMELRTYSTVVLTGPTGVGKSTVLETIWTEYLARHSAAVSASPSFRPLIFTIASDSDSRRFDWKRLYLDAMRGMEDPFRKIQIGRKKHQPLKRRMSGETIGEGLLRQECEEKLVMHDSHWWMIDETQHVLKGTKTRTAGQQCDSLKSVSLHTGVGLIFCGPQSVCDFISHSAQLSRRTKVIYFGPYDFKRSDEPTQIVNCMEAILKQLPSRPKFPNPRDNFKAFFLGCLGCVGIFKDWVSRAYGRMLSESRNILSLEDFRAERLTPDGIARINAEIIAGELAYLRMLEELDMSMEISILNRSLSLETPAVQTISKKRKDPASTRGRAPGVRTPGRDGVPEIAGGANEA